MKRDGNRARVAAAGLGVLLLGWVIGYGFTARMDGPWGMIPGGPFAESEPELACGKLRAIPSAVLTELELEVRAPRPRSITTWSVVVDRSVYVPADFLTPLKRWPHQVLADPRIRVRVGGQIYRCHAERVTQPDRISKLRRAISAKYAIEPDGWASRARVWWFELLPVPN
jgi:hypothetical protein